LQRAAEDLRVKVGVFGFGLRGHESHVVERCEKDATVHGVEVEEALEVEVHGIMGFGPVARGLLCEEIFGAAA